METPIDSAIKAIVVHAESSLTVCVSLSVIQCPFCVHWEPARDADCSVHCRDRSRLRHLRARDGVDPTSRLRNMLRRQLLALSSLSRERTIIAAAAAGGA